MNPGSSSGRSTSTPTCFAPGSASASSTGDTVNAKNCAITLGNSEGNTYNFGETVRNEASSEESPNRPHNRSNTESGANSSSRKGPTTYGLENSSLTGGDSKDNVYNFGSKRSPTAPAPQPQGRVPKASGAGDYGQVMSQASSSAQQGNHPSPLNPATTNTPADLPHAPKMSCDEEADRQGERGSVGNPISSGQEMRMLVTDAVPESPQSNASQFISKMDTTPGPVSDDKSSPAKVESFSECCSDVPVADKMEETMQPQECQEAPPTQQTGSSSGRSTSTPTGFAPGSASASSTGERMIQADRSVIILGNSEGNTYNLGMDPTVTMEEGIPSSML